MSDSSVRRLAKIIQAEVRKVLKPPRWPATVVSAADGRKGYTTVIMDSNGERMDVLNSHAGNVADLRVWVGEDPFHPGELQILGTQELFEQGTGFNIQDHHELHEYPNHDTVWVQGAQLMPLNVLPIGGFEVSVYGSIMYVDGGWVKVSPQTVDLSASQPASGARYVLLETDNAGAVSAVDGSTAATKSLLTASDIPSPTAGSFPIAAIMLYAGQEEISRDTRPGGLNDFAEDIRFSGFAWSGGDGIYAALGHTHLSGKYRQFTWVDDGTGGWEFVSADGEPVMHLQDME